MRETVFHCWTGVERGNTPQQTFGRSPTIGGGGFCRPGEDSTKRFGKLLKSMSFFVKKRSHKNISGTLMVHIYSFIHMVIYFHLYMLFISVEWLLSSFPINNDYFHLCVLYNVRHTKIKNFKLPLSMSISIFSLRFCWTILQSFFCTVMVVGILRWETWIL
jgi:hypothetical protein